MTSSEEELETVDLQVKALAERIADRREIVERLQGQGKRTGYLQSSIEVLTDLFLRRVRYRDLIAATAAGRLHAASTEKPDWGDRGGLL
jgi:hypothetical protein